MNKQQIEQMAKALHACFTVMMQPGWFDTMERGERKFTVYAPETFIRARAEAEKLYYEVQKAAKDGKESEGEAPSGEGEKPLGGAFSIVQALVRCAVAMVPKEQSITNAFKHQAERLKTVLQGGGFNAEALSIEEILTPQHQDNNFKIVRSGEGEKATVTILMDIDSETIHSVYYNTNTAIEVCRIDRRFAPFTFPVQDAKAGEGEKMTPVMIKCPECDTTQAAVVEHTQPWATYVHHCVKCKHIIMESEWNVVKPFKAGEGKAPESAPNDLKPGNKTLK